MPLQLDIHVSQFTYSVMCYTISYRSFEYICWYKLSFIVLIFVWQLWAAMHHLEHGWCGAGRWCLLHWGEDEWYLCKGLDQRSGWHAEHWYPLQVGQGQKSRGNNSVFAVLLPLTKSTSQNYHIFSIIRLRLWIWDC